MRQRLDSRFRGNDKWGAADAERGQAPSPAKAVLSEVEGLAPADDTGLWRE